MQESPSTWTFSEIFANALRQWPIGLAYILIGGLLGWGVSMIWPSPYQATSYIYVGIHPYRAFDDSRFLADANPKYTNLDDYNHWQMSQLEGSLYLDRFIDQTLFELRATDSYWDQVTTEDLRGMIENKFRTAGRWSLMATHADPAHASQAAQTWAQVSAAGVREAIAASRQAIMVDASVQELSTERIEAEHRLETLERVYPEFVAWSQEWSAADGSQAVDLNARLALIAWFSRARADTPIWDEFTNMLPPDGSATGRYLEWAANVMHEIEAEGRQLEMSIDALDAELEELTTEYDLQVERSLGMSPSTVIETIEDQPPESLRPTGLMILNGAVLGMVIWLGVQLAALTRRKPGVRS